MTDVTTFHAQVEACLSSLEQAQPTWQRLRRVPIDMIAEAVHRELEQRMAAVRVLHWNDEAVIAALVMVGLRNGAVLRDVSASMV